MNIIIPILAALIGGLIGFGLHKLSACADAGA